MLYKVLADMVVLIHFIWILFLFFGAFWGVKNRAVKIFHISGLAFAFIIQSFDGSCPLTHFEVWLRAQHHPNLTYAGSFIIHYIEKLVYIELSRSLILIFTIFLCGVNGWFYLKRRR